MENEIYVILRDKQSGYDHQAVAASKNIRWVEARLNSLPGDIRGEFRIRPVRVDGVETELVVFYDRWLHDGECSLSGFGKNPMQRPVLPLEPEERLSETLLLNEAPEEIFGAQKKKKKIVTDGGQSRLQLPMASPPRPLRLYVLLGGAVLVWLAILSAMVIAVRMRPVVLTTQSSLSEGLRFPIGYESPEWVEHAGWIYLESGLSSAAFERMRKESSWSVIASDEVVRVIRPQVLNVVSHKRTGFSFASGLGDDQQWQQDNFFRVPDGYVSNWPDGSQLVYDLASNRIYGRITRVVADKLFAR